MNAALASVLAAAWLAPAHQPTVLVHDLGIVGLLSHDVFGWSDRLQANTDNGRLDLSTIFDYGDGTAWETGGSPKNSENPPVYTVTMALVERYRQELAAAGDAAVARAATVEAFRAQVHESFARITGTAHPEDALCGEVTHAEQAAFRALHDVLPGAVERDDGTWLDITDYRTAMTILTPTELARPVPALDGRYDAAYLSIELPAGLPTVNLKEMDRLFIERYTDYRQDEMLAELAAVGAGAKGFGDVSFYGDFVDVFRRAACGE